MRSPYSANIMASPFNIHLLPPMEGVAKDDKAKPYLHQKTALENYFSKFRKNIIGNQQVFESPLGKKEIVYADWTASGRAYQPIEDCLQNNVMPFIANTHTETTITGTLMSKAYEEAKHIIKQHVNANNDDALFFCGSGMTAAVNKLQRILGLRVPGCLKDYIRKDSPGDEEDAGVNLINRSKHPNEYLPIDEELRPVVFITHMEHHSNQLTWLETIATVEIIKPNKNGNVNLEHLSYLLEKYKHRKNKIAAVTACSNVTGIQTPYHQIAKLVHEYGGLCFVDFACSAPYAHINMHPAEKGAHIDAIYFSMHKFLGGPGTPGVLIFNKKMYKNNVPDQPGGGTVTYTNPWKVHAYDSNIEQREDGGTPPFLQAIKAAMCIKLKEEMGVENMLQREAEMLKIIFARFAKMRNVEVLEANIKKRLGVIAFIVKGAHHNLIVKMLNDRFGVQTRGGCSCAGTYGHILLNVDRDWSYKILKELQAGNLQCKPGWVRLSIHPTMTDVGVDYIMDAIELTACHFHEWIKDYTYHPATNEYTFNGFNAKEQEKVEDWFRGEKWG